MTSRQISRCALVLGLAAASIAACTGGGGGSGNSGGADLAQGGSDGGAGDGGSGSCAGGCPSDSVCSQGQCVKIPASCPCPVETYCDLSSNSCKVGCLKDDQCNSDRWCDTSARSCNDGCRTSAQCPSAGDACVDHACASHHIAALSQGGGHTCGILEGALWCWGQNGDGQLGDGTRNQSTTPKAIGFASSGVTVVAAGGQFTCIVHSGATKCWGYNASYQLGQATATNYETSPQTVSGLSGVTALAAGGDFACALAGGVVKCWGSNGSGELGDDTYTSRGAPTQVNAALPTGATAIGAGDSFACALVSGAVYCWGDNYYHQMGGPSTLDSKVPVQISGISGATQLAVGGDHACAAVSSGVKCWGRNDSNQLGDGTGTTPTNGPVAVSGVSTPPSQLIAGGAHTCGIWGTTVKCWGSQQDSSGTGEGDAPTPVDAMAPTGSKLLSAGHGASCLAVNEASLYCRGDSYSYELGTGKSEYRRDWTEIQGW